MGEQSVLHDTPGSSLEGYAKEAFLTGFSLFSKAIDPLFTESDQVTGMEHVLDADGKLIPGPLLWLLKHESWYDALNVPTMLLNLGVPDMKVPNNRNHL